MITEEADLVEAEAEGEVVMVKGEWPSEIQLLGQTRQRSVDEVLDGAFVTAGDWKERVDSTQVQALQQ